jgi:hypothetical protein
VSGLGDTFRLARHEDDEWFDAVTIRIAERWKESELSGDEWRFSYVMTFWRKGVPLARRSTSRFNWALGYLPSMIDSLAPVGNDDELRDTWAEKSASIFGHPDPYFEEFCAQPGCKALATVEYRLKRSYCNRCGEGKVPNREQRRRFCDAHRRRGDCGLDDADVNYQLARERRVAYNPLDIGDWL